MTTESNRYRVGKNDVQFVTEVEKKIHKILSALRYFESVDFNLDDFESKAELVKAINKSAKYNCMEITTKMINNKTGIRVTADGI